tara:strand:+ start:2097 stop:2483 length:387 start_codon:yes stop_codon:yes gene_type:complete
LKKKKIKISSNRSFGIVFFIVFLAIALWPILNDGDVRIWSIIVSLIFLVLGLLNSNILKPLNKLWFYFGILLGNVVAPIIMSLLFFLVVTPTGLLVRFFGKDLLKLKKSKKDTYWIKKDYKSKMKNQF